jgi:CHAD domain-containing protein
MIDCEPPELIVGPVAARIAARLAAVSARARTDLIEALDGPRFEQIMSTLTAVIDDAGPVASERRRRVRVQRALRRAERLLDAAVTSLSTRDSAATPRLHEARRAYKRARYAVEVLAPAEPPEAARLVRRLKAVQDLLGEVQDAVVAEGLLRDYGLSAYLDRENTFTYGLLYARQRPAGPWSVPGLARARRRAARPRLRRWLG